MKNITVTEKKIETKNGKQYDMININQDYEYQGQKKTKIISIFKSEAPELVIEIMNAIKYKKPIEEKAEDKIYDGLDDDIPFN